MNVMLRRVFQKNKLLQLFKRTNFRFNTFNSTLDKDDEKRAGAYRQNEDSIEEIEFKDATESFMSTINQIDDYDTDDESVNIESFLKSFNQRVYRQNEDLTNKVNELMSNQNGDEDHKANIFAAINEINRVNTHNSSKLLKMFLVEILKYQRNGRKRTQESENFSYNRIILSVNIAILLWIVYKTQTSFFSNPNPSKLAEKMAEGKSRLNDLLMLCSLNKENISLFGVSTISDIESVDTLFLVGDSNSGKTASLLKYAVSQTEAGSFVQYVNLSSTFSWVNVESDMDLLQQVFKLNNSSIGSKIDNLNSTKVAELNSYLGNLLGKSQRKVLIFDNANLKRDNKLLRLIPKLTKLNFKVIIASNSNSELLSHISRFNISNYCVQHLNIDDKAVITKLKEKYNLSSDQTKQIIDGVSVTSLKKLDKSLKSGISLSDFIINQEAYGSKELRLLQLSKASAYTLLNSFKENPGLRQANISNPDINILEKRGLIRYFEGSGYELATIKYD